MHNVELPDLSGVFAAHDVAVAYLFGSRAEGTAHPTSDHDVAVLFADPDPDPDPEPALDATVRLAADLARILGTNVDVVDLDRAECPRGRRWTGSGRARSASGVLALGHDPEMIVGVDDAGRIALAAVMVCVVMVCVRHGRLVLVSLTGPAPLPSLRGRGDRPARGDVRREGPWRAGPRGRGQPQGPPAARAARRLPRSRRAHRPHRRRALDRATPPAPGARGRHPREPPARDARRRGRARHTAGYRLGDPPAVRVDLDEAALLLDEALGSVGPRRGRGRRGGRSARLRPARRRTGPGRRSRGRLGGRPAGRARRTAPRRPSCHGRGPAACR